MTNVITYDIIMETKKHLAEIAPVKIYAKTEKYNAYADREIDFIAFQYLYVW